MVDVEMIDKMYEYSRALWGEPIRMALFDKRALMPLAQLSECVASETGQTIAEEKLAVWLEAGLYPALPRDEELGGLGFPLYVPSRIGVLLDLERAGWTLPELRRVAEMEEWTVDECLTTDELKYEDDDVRLLSVELQMLLDRDGELLAYLEATPQPAQRPSYWDSSVTARELRDRLQGLERYLHRIRSPELSQARRENIARNAFRTRARHEAVRVMLLETDRSQLKKGISPWLVFRETGWSAQEGFRFKGIRWDCTVRGPVLEADDEPLPIRLPGVILRGDDVTLPKASTPYEYERLWREYQLDEYFRARAKVRDERICQHCLQALPEGAKPTKLYCSENCRSAARMHRFRQNSPDKHLAIQERYWKDDA